MESGEGGQESPDAAARKAEVRAALSAGTGRRIQRLPLTAEQLVRREKEQDIALKGTYAWSLLGLMYVQVVIANLVFIAYAWFGREWDIDASVMHVWLSATVVQIVGVVFVVTRSLFPKRDAAEPPDAN